MERKEFRPLTIPNLAWDTKSITNTYGELIAQPLEPGFGTTIGNAIRRVLLGAVEGSAVTSVIIKGINNEFTDIPGVVEDALYVILNIKEIIIKNKTGKPGTMRLVVPGKGVARVADIVADDHLELINKDHILANVSEGGELDITFFVESGRGYQPAQWPVGKTYQEDGRIYLDTTFSPVVKVMFDVEKTRVGGKIDFDKLMLRVQTNGAETPKDVVHYAVSVIRTQLEHFLGAIEVPFNEISTSPVEPTEKRVVTVDLPKLKGIPVDLLLKPIDELELSVRAHNCLISAGITRVIDLVRLKEDDMLKIKNFGRKSLGEVKDSIKAFGLSFGMDLNEEEIKKMATQGV